MARKNEDIEASYIEGEIWKDAPGYEGVFKASSLGRVFSVRGNKVVGSIRKSSGYVVAHHLNNGKHVNTYCHRLVALSWVDNPDPKNKKFVNHKNGIKHDNRPPNLEWCTHSENKLHAFRTGLQTNKGEKQSQSKLTESQVLDIRNRHKNGQAITSIGRDYSHICSLRNVRNIISRTKWTHI